MSTKREARIHYEQIDSLPNAFWNDFEVIGLGHIGCFHKMSLLTEYHLQRIYNLQKEIKIELPIIYENQMQSALHKLHSWMTYPVSLVINDYGMLFELKKLGITENVPIYLGRNLISSFFNCPWYGNILIEEEIDVKEMWNQVNVDNEEMIQFLKENKVVGIDIDISPYMEKSILELRNRGFEVNAFVQNPIASISRSCHIVRNLNEKIGSCQHLCNKPVQLQPMESWNRFDDAYKRISKTTREEIGQLLAYGNVVVSKTNSPLEIDYTVDSICHDFRFSEEIVFANNK
jgi:hypothetical protein